MMRGLGLAAMSLLLGCTGVSDFDGDGALDDADCAPEDASIYPGAPEVCDDGIENDCDTRIDLLDPDCWIGNGEPDIDDDGDGWTEDDGDCNDAEPGAFPGAPETCGDGIDNDCNGVIDDCPDEDAETLVTLLLTIHVANDVGEPVAVGVGGAIWGEWDPVPDLSLDRPGPLANGTSVSLPEARLELTEGERFHLLAVGYASDGCWVFGGLSERRSNPYAGFDTVLTSADVTLRAEGWQSPCTFSLQ